MEIPDSVSVALAVTTKLPPVVEFCWKYRVLLLAKTEPDWAVNKNVGADGAVVSILIADVALPEDWLPTRSASSSRYS